MQAVVTLLELPLDFQNEQLSNKHVNWELAADIVNCNSRIRRSARQVCVIYYFSGVFFRKKFFNSRYNVKQWSSDLVYGLHSKRS